MSDSLFNLLPIFSGVLVTITLLLASRVGLRSLSEVRMKMRRLEIVRNYQFSGKAGAKKLSKQLGMAKVVVGSYGDRLVKDKYRNKLERLLVSSGDWENKKYSKLSYECKLRPVHDRTCMEEF